MGFRAIPCNDIQAESLFEQVRNRRVLSSEAFQQGSLLVDSVPTPLACTQAGSGGSVPMAENLSC